MTSSSPVVVFKVGTLITTLPVTEAIVKEEMIRAKQEENIKLPLFVAGMTIWKTKRKINGVTCQSWLQRDNLIK